MRPTVLLAFFVGLSCLATAQLTSIFHEVHYSDDGMVTDYPAGYVTYRVYASVQDADDAVVACFAELTTGELYLGSDNDEIWNSEFGAITGDQLNDAFFPFFPSVEYDSMVTIGRANASVPGGTTTTVSTAPSTTVFDDAFGVSNEYAAGLEMGDGTWFATPDQENGYGEGEDNRVLLAQITCGGDIAYRLNIMVLNEGVGGESFKYAWEADNSIEYIIAPELGLIYPFANCCDPVACNYDGDSSMCDNTLCDYSSCQGCTDPAYCNYDAEATQDDGSCTNDCPGCTNPIAENYDPLATIDDGSCILIGCTDNTACNYDPTATQHDPFMCDFTCLGCTDPEACNYDEDATMDNGTCTAECEGCTDPEASNYDPTATVDDGSCIQGYDVYLEHVMEHTGPTEDGVDLNGMHTWRMYIDCQSPLDKISAVYGDIDNPLHIASTTNFWHSDFGGPLGTDISEAFIPLFPSLAYDSWVTIGVASNATPGAVTALDDEGELTIFEAGGDLEFSTLIGGIWFSTVDQPNVVAGDDQRVLLGQFTTDGTIDYCINVQVFQEGDQEQSIILPFCGQSSGAGCTDPAACNYDPWAIEDDGSCTTVCPGCTDASADNYDESATEDDGSCIFSGCTDAAACNYDDAANTDDGSCDYACLGCTDNTACNYNPEATEDDGSCTTECLGCTDPDADNYDATANIDDGNCEYAGCMDDSACNYDPTANVPFTCDYSCYGCTDPEATNYDPDATVDNGSCYNVDGYGLQVEVYAEHDGVTEDGVDLTGYTTYRLYVTSSNPTDELSAFYGLQGGQPLEISSTTGFWQSEMGGPTAEDLSSAFAEFFPSLWYDSYLTVGKESSEDPGDVFTAFAIGDLTDFEDSGADVDIEDGAVFALVDSPNTLFGDEQRVLVAQLTTQGSISACFGVQIFVGGDQSNPLLFDLCATSAGCTDPASCNYDPIAVEDDGSCTTLCPGCMDPEALNYDDSATVDDGSCAYLGCTDASACNYDPIATDDDGSCDFDCMGCTDAAACNYDDTATQDDGSCCFENCLTINMYDSFGDGWNGAEWQLSTSDSEDDVILSGSLFGEGTDIFEDSETVCVSDGCYFFRVTEDLWEIEVSWDLETQGVQILSGNANSEWFLIFLGESNCEAGCTDPGASNYDPDATINFGCIYPGCTDTEAVNYDATANQNDGSCSYEVHGYVFYDGNTNGLFDQDGFDSGLPYQNVTLMPDNITAITDTEGYYSFGTLPEGDYTLSVDNADGPFPINTTDASVDLNISEEMDNGQLDFGLADDNAISAICVDFYPFVWGYPCNGIEVLHNICFRNMGTEPISGIVELTYDELFDGHVEITPILSENGNVVQMAFVDLMPGEMFFYDIKLITPSLDFMGEVLTSHVSISAYDQFGELEAYGEETLAMEVTCAYDPNDKMVFPFGYADPHFVEPEVNLEYVVRFQNTGNDTANVVIIQDTLSPYLDFSSFQLMANSHDVLTTIDNETGAVEFLFENILLPDSNINEPESHGLVSYMIKPLEDLPHGTVIENTAHIFFDTNPAIVTNTTWNTIYICDDSMMAVAPGDTEICLGEALEVTATGEYIEEIFWDSENDPSAMDWTYEFSESGDYELVIVAENPLCMDMDTVYVQVHDVLESMSFTVSDNLLTADLADSWQWFFNGEAIEGATGQSITATASGQYSVVGYTAEGCGTASAEQEVIVTHITEYIQSSLNLYPNPALDGAWLESAYLEGAAVSLVDASGRELAQIGRISSNRLWIDRGEFAAGLYVVRVTSNTGQVYTLPVVWK